MTLKVEIRGCKLLIAYYVSISLIMLLYVMHVPTTFKNNTAIIIALNFLKKNLSLFCAVLSV